VGEGPIVNEGTIFLADVKIHDNNRTIGGGGGIANFGVANITNTSISRNGVVAEGGGISNAGVMTIANSTVTDNVSIGTRQTAAGGILNIGTLHIVSSTIARNSSAAGSGVFGGGIENRGNLTVLNSTITANDASVGGGIFNTRGTVELRNTIVAGNTVPNHPSAGGPDCAGEIISLGNNLIGDPSGCSIALQPSDLTGDAGLGTFIDDGAPGHGRFRLLAGSPAIDSGNDSACFPRDQLGTPRLDRCDIGAVEFYPVINDLVAAGNVTTAFDPAPALRAPAGTFRIAAEFINTGSHSIRHRFAEVIELSGGSLLLNADGGPGGVGARLAAFKSGELQPGAAETFEFLIGLQTQEQFTFVVNMLGDAELQKSKDSVAMR
jgi:hypothetical protein